MDLDHIKERLGGVTLSKHHEPNELKTLFSKFANLVREVNYPDVMGYPEYDDAVGMMKDCINKLMQEKCVSECITRHRKPTYFFGIRLPFADLWDKGADFQDHLSIENRRLANLMIDPRKFHLTLFVFSGELEGELERALEVFDEFKGLLPRLVSSPMAVTLDKFDSFSSSVLFLTSNSNEERTRFESLASEMKNFFIERGVCIPDEKPPKLHCTLAKGNVVKAEEAKRMLKHSDYTIPKTFGTYPLASIDLCSMVEKPTEDDQKGFYKIIDSVPLPGFRSQHPIPLDWKRPESLEASRGGSRNFRGNSRGGNSRGGNSRFGNRRGGGNSEYGESGNSRYGNSRGRGSSRYGNSRGGNSFRTYQPRQEMRHCPAQDGW
eukprot:TRINITY_DN9109_c0_g2_i2.p1 TRINITY_DN9109_c0_g2~~TRINITY_DN9109_c0_g2_i2.p1  ORF type:complete len:391 (+),score=104.24 TRINITY_DN9109_c0_g2_i2:41-1174(+)